MIKLKSLISENKESFEDWFSGSKITEPSGKPKLLYHGTNKPIDKFSSSRMGKSSNVFGTWEIKRHGIFLAEDKDLALEFGNHLVMAYGRCYDPLDLSQDMSDAIFNTIQSHVDKYHPNEHGNAGFHFARFIARHSNSSNAWKLFDEDEGYDPEYMIKIFKELGYDGVIIAEPSEKSTNPKVWVLFDSDQIWIVNRGVV